MATQTMQWGGTSRRETDAEGLTPKQRDMSTARNPMNGNVPNEAEPKEPKAPAAPKVSQEQRALEAGQEPQKQQQKQEQMKQELSPLQAQVNQVATKLGNFGFMLQNKVNQFMQQAAANVGSKDIVTYDSTGKAIISGQKADYDPVLQEKLAQQQGIRQSANPFVKEIAGRLYAKDFSEVAKENMGDTPETRQLLGLLEQMNALDAQGYSNSPEYKALQKTLETFDGSGMVSGLIQARDQYNSMMGLGKKEQTKWFGDEGDKGYGLLDVAQLSKETIDTEVKKAATLSSGLFGGNFEANLQRAFDNSSAEAQKSDLRQSMVNRGLGTAIKKWVSTVSTGVMANQEKYKAALNDAAKQVFEELKKNPETTAEAQAWMEASADGKPLSEIMMAALDNPDSGLAPSTRKSLTKYLGEIQKQTGGEFSQWIDDMGKKGSFTVHEADGSVHTVTPSYEQKRNLLNIMENPTEAATYKYNDLVTGQEVELKGQEAINAYAQEHGVSVDEASANLRDKAIQDAFGEINVDESTKLSSHISRILQETSTPEKLQETIHGMVGSLVTSMKNFAGSKLSKAVSMALGLPAGSWEGMSGEKRAAAIKEAMTKNPNLLKELAASVNAKVAVIDQETASTISNNMTVIDKQEEELKGVTQGLVEAKTKLAGVIPEIAAQVRTKALDSIMDVANKPVDTKAIMESPTVQSMGPGIIGSSTIEKLALIARYEDIIKYVHSLGGNMLQGVQIPSTPDIAELLTKYRNSAQANYGKDMIGNIAEGESGIGDVYEALKQNFEVIKNHLSSPQLQGNLEKYITENAGKTKKSQSYGVLGKMDSSANNWNQIFANAGNAVYQTGIVDKSLAEAANKQAKLNTARSVLSAIPGETDKFVGDNLDARTLISQAIAGKSSTYRKARTSEDLSPQEAMALLVPGGLLPTPAEVRATDFNAGSVGSLSSSNIGSVGAFQAPEPVREITPEEDATRGDTGDVRSEKDWSEEESAAAPQGIAETDVTYSNPADWDTRGYEGTPLAQGLDEDRNQQMEQEDAEQAYESGRDY